MKVEIESGNPGAKFAAPKKNGNGERVPLNVPEPLESEKLPGCLRIFSDIYDGDLADEIERYESAESLLDD